MATGGWWQRNWHGCGKNSRAREGMNQTYPKIISPFFTWIIAHLALPSPLPRASPPRENYFQWEFIQNNWISILLVYQSSYCSLKIFHAWLDKTSLLHAVYQCECLLFHARIRSRYSSKSDSAWASVGSIGTTPRGRSCEVLESCSDRETILDYRQCGFESFA
jgi:hypothetical protein